MKKIDGETHGVCEEMVASLQATINTLQEPSQSSRAFETVIDYIESDNESDMNPETIALIEILRDLQDKAIGEEIDGHYREEQNITTLYVVDGENGEVIEQPINNAFNIDVNNEDGYASMLLHGVSIYFTKEEAEEKRTTLREENDG